MTPELTPEETRALRAAYALTWPGSHAGNRNNLHAPYAKPEDHRLLLTFAQLLRRWPGDATVQAAIDNAVANYRPAPAIVASASKADKTAALLQELDL